MTLDRGRDIADASGPTLLRITRLQTDLQDELRWAKDWLVGAALPFWAEAGFDRSTGLFAERLDFAGRRPDVPLRLMVQCRQIYVFAHAALLGWFDGRAYVEQGLRALLDHFALPGDPARFAFSIDGRGEVADQTADTYGYAFLLFALAWARRLVGDQVDPGRVAAIVDFLQTRLRHDSGHGFIDSLPRKRATLRQNPQMHLLEACLEVSDVFALPRARAICDDTVALFGSRLFSADDLALPELHDDHWQIADRAQAVFEPGHHFEWIWLLERYRAVTGQIAPTPPELLAQRALREGIDRDGAVIETVRIADGERTLSRRCWASCEGLKAAAADFKAGRDPDAAQHRAAGFLRALRTVFLIGPFAGGWIDRSTADRQPLVDYVPASTLYHLTLAIAEAHRAFSDRA